MALKRINEFLSREGMENELYEFLLSIVPYIKESEGNLGCEVLQSKEDRTRIVVIEEWENEEFHKKSVENYPPAKMREAMMLIAAPPKGEYFI